MTAVFLLLTISQVVPTTTLYVIHDAEPYAIIDFNEVQAIVVVNRDGKQFTQLYFKRKAMGLQFTPMAGEKGKEFPTNFIAAWINHKRRIPYLSQGYPRPTLIPHAKVEPE